MKSTLILMAAVGCSSSKPADAPPPKVAESPPPTPVARDACSEGKLTVEDSSVREQDRAVVFCKDDGSPAIQYVLLFKGEVQSQKTVPISMDRWREIWRLADAANWVDGPIKCEPGDEAGYTFHTVRGYQAGLEKELSCDGSDFAGPWKTLSEEVFRSRPARD